MEIAEVDTAMNQLQTVPSTAPNVVPADARDNLDAETQRNQPSPPPIAAWALKRWRVSEQDWENNRPRIEQLYRDEGKTLKEVMIIMEMEHSFWAR
jgi:hypothetical protein